jgi:GNAT superfamily N-acetyltransferase
LAAPDLIVRPLRPADRERVLEITADVWEGQDYVPVVLDDWLADPRASFQGAEVDGVLVGIQRLRPIGEGLMLYEGLRVASSHRRQGIARAMLRSAVEETRGLGFRELRLITGNPHAQRLFESEGFEILVALKRWRAGRVEGGEPARIPDASEAAAAFARLRADPAFAAYGGVLADFRTGPVDLDEERLARLAAEGRLRMGTGGRALAILRGSSGEGLRALLVAGSGAALQDLLMALRFEADADGLPDAMLWTPEEHPAASDLEAVGYDWRVDPHRIFVYALRLAR